MMDDFELDDSEFAAGAAVNKITEGYAKVFENIENIAREAKALALGGATTEIKALTNKLTQRVGGLVELQAIDKVIRGGDGNYYSALGDLIENEDFDSDSVFGDPDKEMTEDEYVKRVDEIILSSTAYSYDEAKEINNKNVADDGKDHGDLDDVEW